MFSNSAVIITGDLAGYIPRITGQMLFGAVVIALVIGLISQFGGVPDHAGRIGNASHVAAWPDAGINGRMVAGWRMAGS